MNAIAHLAPGREHLIYTGPDVQTVATLHQWGFNFHITDYSSGPELENVTFTPTGDDIRTEFCPGDLIIRQIHDGFANFFWHRETGATEVTRIRLGGHSAMTPTRS